MKLFESESKKPQINLTSLIDILFLLIIFFAVTTQFSQQKAIGINLPQKVKTASKIYTTKNLILSMKNSNEIFLNGKKFVWSNLGKEIQHKRYDRKQKVVLNIDQNIPHGKVIALLDLLRVHHYKKVVFGTNGNS
ncbi:MAG: biopolymer transport protein ExbD [bacterium]|jgi:biopolymer transport protein ExbD